MNQFSEPSVASYSPRTVPQSYLVPVIHSCRSTQWPKVSDNTAVYDSVNADLTPLNFTYLYCYFMMPHEVICVSEFVLFNNFIIFVLFLVTRQNCCFTL